MPGSPSPHEQTQCGQQQWQNTEVGRALYVVLGAPFRSQALVQPVLQRAIDRSLGTREQVEDGVMARVTEEVGSSECHDLLARKGIAPYVIK
jgi:hypothetical protein